MARRRQIYEGKAKVIFEGPEPGTLVQYFKDDATAFNNQKRGTITGKGVLNNRISEYLMTRIGEIGVPTHFVRRLNMREQLIKEVEGRGPAPIDHRILLQVRRPGRSDGR
jgi:phosphoribosylaminoimidazole-succinocarboxamide synthase